MDEIIKRCIESISNNDSYKTSAVKELIEYAEKEFERVEECRDIT